MSWASDLKKLTTKGGKDLGELSQAIKIELFSGIVSETRYKSGRLRGNWQIQENEKPEGEIDRLDPTGDTVTAEIEQKSTSDGLTYFVNNLPYAKKYEEIDGMVGSNVARLRQNVKEMARKVK